MVGSSMTLRVVKCSGWREVQLRNVHNGAVWSVQEGYV